MISNAWLGVMLLQISGGNCVGLCLSCLIILDRLAWINSGKLCMSGIFVIGGISGNCIVGGHRCCRLLFWRS